MPCWRPEGQVSPVSLQPPPGFSQESSPEPQNCGGLNTYLNVPTLPLKAWAPEEDKIPPDLPSIPFFFSQTCRCSKVLAYHFPSYLTGLPPPKTI